MTVMYVDQLSNTGECEGSIQNAKEIAVGLEILGQP